MVAATARNRMKKISTRRPPITPNTQKTKTIAFEELSFRYFGLLKANAPSMDIHTTIVRQRSTNITAYFVVFATLWRLCFCNLHSPNISCYYTHTSSFACIDSSILCRNDTVSSLILRDSNQTRVANATVVRLLANSNSSRNGTLSLPSAISIPSKTLWFCPTSHEITIFIMIII